MKGTLSHELDVKAPAGKVWEIYGTLQLSRLVPQLVPDLIEKIVVEEGDGGVGTVLRATVKSEQGSKSYKEKFVTVDNERRLKETVTIEGGVLDLGFSSYAVSFEILEKDQNSSTIRSTIKYEISEELAAYASFINTGGLAAIAEGVAKHLREEMAN